MVKLEEVPDEALYAEQPGPKDDEDDWDTDEGQFLQLYRHLIKRENPNWLTVFPTHQNPKFPTPKTMTMTSTSLSSTELPH